MRHEFYANHRGERLWPVVFYFSFCCRRHIHEYSPITGACFSASLKLESLTRFLSRAPSKPQLFSSEEMLNEILWEILLLLVNCSCGMCQKNGNLIGGLMDWISF